MQVQAATQPAAALDCTADVRAAPLPCAAGLQRQVLYGGLRIGLVSSAETGPRALTGAAPLGNNHALPMRPHPRVVSRPLPCSMSR